MAKNETQLSEAARKALVNLRGSAQGTLVSIGVNFAVLTELMDAGLIGLSYGLTRRGSIVTERVKRQAEDAAFS